eukprot:scaffold62273_cov67-Cyclotella_meneghiniana.AAC.1
MFATRKDVEWDRRRDTATAAGFTRYLTINGEEDSGITKSITIVVGHQSSLASDVYVAAGWRHWILGLRITLAIISAPREYTKCYYVTGVKFTQDQSSRHLSHSHAPRLKILARQHRIDEATKPANIRANNSINTILQHFANSKP